MKSGSVYIRGLEEAQSDASGKFVVAITSSGASTEGKTVITFHSGDVTVGDTVRVGYQRRVVNGALVPVKTTSTTAKGSLYCHWPVYSDGSSCADAGILGILHLHIYKVRVTALPGFSNSYKTGATNGLTFGAINPKIGGDKMYDLVFEPMDADGNIVNKSSVATSSVGWIIDDLGGAASASASA